MKSDDKIDGYEGILEKSSVAPKSGDTVLRGWECPRCFTVYAPHIQSCSACDNAKGAPGHRPYPRRAE